MIQRPPRSAPFPYATLFRSARNRELLALAPATLLVTAGFTALFIQRNDVLSNASLTIGAVFLVLCIGANNILRFTPPYADPRSEGHTSEIQSRQLLVCRLLF